MKRLTVFIALAFYALHAHATETIDFDSLSLNQVILTNHTNNSINVDLFAKVGGACNAGETATFLTDNEFVINHKGKFVNNFKIINQNTQRAQFTFSPIAEQKRLTLNTNVPEIVSLRRTSVFLNYIMNATLLSYWYHDENQIYIHFYPADANIQTINNEVALLTQSRKSVRSSQSLRALLSASSLGSINSFTINILNGRVVVKEMENKIFEQQGRLTIDVTGGILLNVNDRNTNTLLEEITRKTALITDLTTERVTAIAERDSAKALQTTAEAERDTAIAERDSAKAAQTTAEAERDTANKKNKHLSEILMLFGLETLLSDDTFNKLFLDEKSTVSYHIEDTNSDNIIDTLHIHVQTSDSNIEKFSYNIKYHLKS